ncbi:MAG: hypothetical protein WCF84_04230 [Anaerolineae bacterium]
MELYPQLALLTDAEAEMCLNGLLKGLTVVEPEYAALVARPEEMESLLAQVAEQAGRPALTVPVSPHPDPKAVRTILVQAAQDPELSPKLEAWLQTARPKLIEPVTTALVLAGIVLLLSTHVKVEYEDKGGKKHLKVMLEKKPTANKILDKFFGLF